NRYEPQRQPERVRLRLQQLDSDGMHRDPLRRLVDRRQQRADLDVSPLTQHVNHPRAVFAAGPRNQALGHLVIWSSGYLVNHIQYLSGCSARAKRPAASTIRGPGTTNSSPTSRCTRLFLTAGTAARLFQTSRSASIRADFNDSP